MRAPATDEHARGGRFAASLALASALSASACSSAGGATATRGDAGDANDAGDETSFVVPDTGPGIDYPDSTAGYVAAHLAGCGGIEPGCHGDSPSSGLVLGRTPALDLAQLIGVRSTERVDLYRVQPGDPSKSWLYLKVLGDREAGVDTPMPLGSAGDPAFALQLQAWIEAGAPNPFGDAGP